MEVHIHVPPLIRDLLFLPISAKLQ